MELERRQGLGEAAAHAASTGLVDKDRLDPATSIGHHNAVAPPACTCVLPTQKGVFPCTTQSRTTSLSPAARAFRISAIRRVALVLSRSICGDAIAHRPRGDTKDRPDPCGRQAVVDELSQLIPVARAVVADRAEPGGPVRLQTVSSRPVADGAGRSAGEAADLR